MVTIRKATKQEQGTLKGSLYLIERNGLVVGIITKLPNTRTDIHPYKVFRRESSTEPNTMLNVFYDDADSVKIGPAFDYEKCNIGGKTAAFLFARKVFANG